MSLPWPPAARLGRLGLPLLALLALGNAAAATLRVGPGGLATIAEAARLARDGDVVEIAAGTYRRDVAAWPQRRLTLRGVGGQPELVADGADAEGKAIWVIRDGDFMVENIAFRGARVPHGNGAGIRFEKGRLTVRNCRFEDNEMGILTGNDPESRLTIEDSEFAHAPRGAEHPAGETAGPPQGFPAPPRGAATVMRRPGGGLKHLLYVGHIARVEIRGSRFHDGYVAHLVKSRARESDLRYNLVWDGPTGSASYEMDFPNGGVVTLIGNLVGQSDATSNPALISFGAEGSGWPEHRLTLSHNTLSSEAGPNAHFVRVWSEKLGPVRTRLVNNLLVGPGILEGGDAAGGNVSGALVNPRDLDFRPAPTTVSVAPPPTALAPGAQFSLPTGTQPLGPPRRWLPGALQPARGLP